MSQLTKLLDAVKEQNLTKTQLEDFHSELTNLYAQMMLEMAELEKEEARYFLTMKKSDDGDRPDIVVKRMWRGTESGQRLIELARYSKALEKMLSSVKNRIYSQL